MGAGSASLVCGFELIAEDAGSERRAGFLAALCMLDFELPRLLRERSDAAYHS